MMVVITSTQSKRHASSVVVLTEARAHHTHARTGRQAPEVEWTRERTDFSKGPSASLWNAREVNVILCAWSTSAPMIFGWQCLQVKTRSCVSSYVSCESVRVRSRRVCCVHTQRRAPPAWIQAWQTGSMAGTTDGLTARLGPAGVTVVYTHSLGLTLVSTTNSRRINASAGKTPMHCGWSWVRSVRCCDGMITTARPYLRAHARTPPHDGQPGTVGGGLPCGVLLAYPWLTAE